MTSASDSVAQRIASVRGLLGEVAKAGQAKARLRLQDDFAEELQAKVIDPWHKRVVKWLSGLTDTPTVTQLDAAMRKLTPDRDALQAVLEEYHLQAANMGGQRAVDKIMRGRVGKAGPPAAEEVPQQYEAPKNAEGFVFNLRDPQLLEALGERGTRVTGEVTETMLADLRGVLSAKFYDEGIGPKGLVEEIDDIFPPTYANRALTIARTETLFAQAEVQNECYTRNGVEGKQWLAFIDEKTRDDHAAMHEVTVPMGEPFILPDGSELMFPGEEGGDAGEVINCRCDFLPVFGDGYELPEQPWLGGEAA